MEIKKVAVLGAGVMGKQIALLIARYGYRVCCYSKTTKTIGIAKKYVSGWIDRNIQKGKIDDTAIEQIKNQLSFTTDLKEACNEADFVIESVIENLEVKRSVLKEADQLTPKHTIYATNSSYIVSSQIKDVLMEPSYLLNMHFFNPASAMNVVEVVKGDHVSGKVFDIACEFAKSIGKTPIRIDKEIYGFVVNRIFSALTREACYLVDQNVASIEDIDKAVKGALGHAMGPLETLDMTGIDLEYNVYMDKFKKTGNLADRPAVCLTERYAKGEYGIKTGKGFYEYNSNF